MTSTPYTTTNTVRQDIPGDTQIGASSTTLLAFHGATPTDQYAAITSVSTLGSVSTSPFGFSTSAQADALVTAVNSLILMAREKGLITT